MVRYLVRLRNRQRFHATGIPVLLARMAETVRPLAPEVKVRALRVSPRALEFDLFADSDAQAAEATANLQAQFGPLLTRVNLSAGELTRGLLDVPAIVSRAVALFNEERFWESQETLEAAWTQLPRGAPEREVLQGIILVGAAFVHHQKAEDSVCLGMLRRALTHVERHPAIARANNFYGLNVADFVGKCHIVLRRSGVRPFRCKGTRRRPCHRANNQLATMKL